MQNMPGNPLQLPDYKPLIPNWIRLRADEYGFVGCADPRGDHACDGPLVHKRTLNDHSRTTAAHPHNGKAGART